LKDGSKVVTAGQFGTTVPIGAEQTATGYDVAWKIPSANEYTAWSVDSNGNYISNIIGDVPANSTALEALETTFHQDLNGDGTIGVPTMVIQTNGSIALTEVGNNYFLYDAGTGPELKDGGKAVTAGQFGTTVPIGAVQTATGYDVAWKIPSANEYTVWSVDSNGNYISNIIGDVPANSAALEALETTFHQDLNGDGTIGIPGTFSLQYKGFDYVAFYNGAYENSDSLPSLTQTGANSIEATLDYGIDVATSQVVADPNYTDSLAALGSTIAQAESLGLSVMVRPLIDFLNPSEIAPYSVGDWRQDYQPTNVATFFASYQQMIVQEAQVAQANGAQMLSIGAELDQLTGSQYLSYWTDIITAVRQVFSGALTYSASWDTAGEVSFWSQLNYEGIDNYVPLSNAPTPTLQDLVNGWLEPATASKNPGAYTVIGNQSPIEYFENLSAQSGKPLLFTELGYANDSGAAADPSASGNSPAPTLQAELYQAFFQAWTQSKSTALAGTYFWEWDPNGSTSNVGPNIDSFSPQNSPALNQAIAGFEAVSVPAGAHLTLSEAIGAQGLATIGTGASLELAAADSGSVKFGGPTGILILDHPSTFAGLIFDLTGNGSLSGSDQIDLRDIDFGPGTTVAYTGNTTGGLLTVSDAQHHTASIELAGNYAGSTFSLSSDGGGGTIVIDPPVKQDLAGGTLSFSDPGPTATESVTVSPQNGGAGYIGNFTVDAVTTANGRDSAGWHFNFDSGAAATTVTQSYEVTVADHHTNGTNSTATQSVTVTIAGAGNDAFVFHPDVGADTVVNATSADTIELDGFSSVTSNRQLASLLTEAQAGLSQSLFQTANGGHDTLINLGNHDVITLANVALSALHASDFIIH
jgi:VCBS repeat-containing protein